MSSPPAGPIYTVDSSSLMDWQGRYYPADVFTTLVGRVNTLADEGRLLIPALVEEEVEALGVVSLVRWVEGHPQIVVPTQEVLAEALAIQGQFPGLRDPKSAYEEADAYVIALAKFRAGVVVTQETPAAEKHKPKRSHYIPDVCRELGIPCISLLGVMRREGWVL